MNEFTTFYTDNRERLHHYLIRRCGDAQLAADIVQESFTRFWEQYRHHGENGALLFTIARNLLYDHFRQVQKIANDNEKIEKCASASIEAEHEHKEQYRRTQEAIRTLPNDERYLLASVVERGYSYQEIADMTGLSVANIKIKVHRIRKKLQQLLTDKSQ